MLTRHSLILDGNCSQTCILHVVLYSNTKGLFMLKQKSKSTNKSNKKSTQKDEISSPKFNMERFLSLALKAKRTFKDEDLLSTRTYCGA